MSVNIKININVNAGDKNKPKTPWKNGFYYSDKNTAELKKFDGNTVRTHSIGKTISCDSYTVFPQIVSALELFPPLNSFRTCMYCGQRS